MTTRVSVPFTCTACHCDTTTGHNHEVVIDCRGALLRKVARLELALAHQRTLTLAQANDILQRAESLVRGMDPYDSTKLAPLIADPAAPLTPGGDSTTSPGRPFGSR